MRKPRRVHSPSLAREMPRNFRLRMSSTRRTRRLLAPLRRVFSSSSPAHTTLPILRLPTTLFPHQCFSLTSLEPPEHERRYNVLTPEQLQEVWSEHGGRLAALAWGSSVGVELQLLQLDDTEVPDAPLPTPPLVHHAVGGRRLRLFELLDERSGSGSRLGVVAPLRAEADAARKLLHSAATPLELSLCTLDEARPPLHPRTAFASSLPPLHLPAG